MSTLQRTLWHRSLEHYPDNTRRIWYLALAVTSTIMLYYEAYVLFSVAPLVQASFHLSFQAYIYSTIVANVLGAVAAIFGSLSDRIGRGNLIVYGLLVTGIGTLLITLAATMWVFLLFYWILGFVEGIILTVTPALVRDFSPRLGRATAMGFWTVGPVGGSVLATVVASQTLPLYNSWQSQYLIAGIVGLIVFLICFFSLRELAPGLRNQIMNSLREKTLVEARARSIDVEAALKHPWRQMVRPRLVVSAFGIAIFLLIYYAAVGVFPLYLVNIFKFSLAEANGLVGVFWIVNVVAAILGGFISDRTLVRKPYMLGGCIATIIVTLFFISRIGQPTGGTLMAILLGLFGLTIAIAYVPWMAGYTETVENVNPALVATGLAVWGFVLRWVVVISAFIQPFVVGDARHGELWAIWWWVCIGGMLLFIPTIFLATGYWNPARARTETRERERAAELVGEAAEPA